MKKPRVTDFDPSSRVPELGSPMDHMPAIGKPPLSPIAPSVEASPARAEGDQSEPLRAYGRPSVRTGSKRTLKRHPFEIFDDQLTSLKQFSLQDQLNGGQGSMSAMVREALDNYIQNRNPSGE